MPRKSSIRNLPDELRDQLDQALLAGKLTIDQLHDFVRSRLDAEDAPSRSALGRYAKSFNESARILRENRETAKALAQELGSDSVEGEQGRLLVEMLRGFLFKSLHNRTAEDGELDLKEVSHLARSLKDLAQAMHLEQDFARKIREQARQEAQEEMRLKLNSAASSGQLNAEAAQEARRILGFSDE